MHLAPFTAPLPHAAGARAAVEEVVRRGVADPAHVSVGGHSYGAFMAANLLAHAPDLFAAGGAWGRAVVGRAAAVPRAPRVRCP